MRELPEALRWYLSGLYLACVALVAWQVTPLIEMALHGHVDITFTTILYAALFIAVAYAGERTWLQVSSSVGQSLTTPVHMAMILLFPPPYPMLITLVAVIAFSQTVHRHSPLYKRLFNVSHETLLVGLSSALCAIVVSPTSILRPGAIVQALPILLALMALYYVLDDGMMLGVLCLLERRAPWRVWVDTYRRSLLPELGMSAIGILAATSWQYDHLLLAMFVLPVVALRVAFRAIAEAEKRATALRRHGDQLEAVLAAGHSLRLPQNQLELLATAADAARTITGAEAVSAYVRDEDDPAALVRAAPALDGEGAGPERIDVPAARSGISDGPDCALLVPLDMEGAGVVGALRVTGVDPDVGFGRDDRDVLSILATQTAIALQNVQLFQQAQDVAAAREAARIKSELLSTVSHELRTPLGAIKGFASGLLAYGERMGADERAEAVSTIDQEADRLTELIDNLLQAQRMEAVGLHIARAPVDVVGVARQVIGEMAPAVPRHTLALHASGDESLVLGDARRLRQVVHNLLSNAIKYSPDGGPIDVTVVGRDNTLELRVADQGLGIPADQLGRVFEWFHRVDNSNTRRIGGTGLGLAIVKGLIEAHGGDVRAESAGPGHGSEFVVTLPALPAGAATDGGEDTSLTEVQPVA